MVLGAGLGVRINFKIIPSRQPAKGNILSHTVAITETKVKEVVIELVTCPWIRNSLVYDFQIVMIFYNFFDHQMILK